MRRRPDLLVLCMLCPLLAPRWRADVIYDVRAKKESSKWVVIHAADCDAWTGALGDWAARVLPSNLFGLRQCMGLDQSSCTLGRTTCKALHTSWSMPTQPKSMGLGFNPPEIIKAAKTPGNQLLFLHANDGESGWAGGHACCSGAGILRARPSCPGRRPACGSRRLAPAPRQRSRAARPGSPAAAAGLASKTPAHRAAPAPRLPAPAAIADGYKWAELCINGSGTAYVCIAGDDPAFDRKFYGTERSKGHPAHARGGAPGL